MLSSNIEELVSVVSNSLEGDVEMSKRLLGEEHFDLYQAVRNRKANKLYNQEILGKVSTTFINKFYSLLLIYKPKRSQYNTKQRLHYDLIRKIAFARILLALSARNASMAECYIMK